jgi:hypothetical protein
MVRPVFKVLQEDGARAVFLDRPEYRCKCSPDSIARCLLNLRCREVAIRAPMCFSCSELIFFSCSEQGPRGPQGLPGAVGKVGTGIPPLADVESYHHPNRVFLISS